jgi:hypothetical protein
MRRRPDRYPPNSSRCRCLRSCWRRTTRRNSSRCPRKRHSHSPRIRKRCPDRPTRTRRHRSILRRCPARRASHNNLRCTTSRSGKPRTQDRMPHKRSYPCRSDRCRHRSTPHNSTSHTRTRFHPSQQCFRPFRRCLRPSRQPLLHRRLPLRQRSFRPNLLSQRCLRFQPSPRPLPSHPTRPFPRRSNPRCCNPRKSTALRPR